MFSFVIRKALVINERYQSPPIYHLWATQNHHHKFPRMRFVETKRHAIAQQVTTIITEREHQPMHLSLKVCNFLCRAETRRLMTPLNRSTASFVQNTPIGWTSMRKRYTHTRKPLELSMNTGCRVRWVTVYDCARVYAASAPRKDCFEDQHLGSQSVAIVRGIRKQNSGLVENATKFNSAEFIVWRRPGKRAMLWMRSDDFLLLCNPNQRLSVDGLPLRLCGILEHSRVVHRRFLWQNVVCLINIVSYFDDLKEGLCVVLFLALAKRHVKSFDEWVSDRIARGKGNSSG